MMAVVVGCLVALFSVALDATAGGIRVRCEERPRVPRSKIDVHGSGFTPGALYSAEVTSGGADPVASGQQAALVNGEVSFDFDSDHGNVLAGATAISPYFIPAVAAPKATGRILNAAGNYVGSVTATCVIK